MKYLKKDITTVEQGIIVQGVNCMAVMGSGVAAAIRRKWPQVFEPYKKICLNYNKSGRALLGSVNFVEITPELIIANVFSQEFYGNDGVTYASPIAIILGLQNVFTYAEKANMPIYSVKIGCGLGGLSWEKDVEPIFTELETQYPLVPIYICEK